MFIGYTKFITWMNAHRDIGEYYTLVAYRVAFDVGILEGLFRDQAGSTRKLYDYIQYKTLDVLQLVLFAELYGLLHDVKNHKLATMCEYYGIDLDAHDSMEDIVATRKLHKQVMGDLRLPSATIKNV